MRRVEARVLERLAQHEPQAAARAGRCAARASSSTWRRLREHRAHDGLGQRVAREVDERALSAEHAAARRDDDRRDAAGARDGDDDRSRVVPVDHAHRRASSRRGTSVSFDGASSSTSTTPTSVSASMKPGRDDLAARVDRRARPAGRRRPLPTASDLALGEDDRARPRAGACRRARTRVACMMATGGAAGRPRGRTRGPRASAATASDEQRRRALTWLSPCGRHPAHAQLEVAPRRPDVRAVEDELPVDVHELGARVDAERALAPHDHVGSLARLERAHLRRRCPAPTPGSRSAT